MVDIQWYNKRFLRSIDQLRPWGGNPRLNPVEAHTTLADFVLDITEEVSDKDNFLELVWSIATNGFIQADPIVVWQDDKNKKYYVAEGNRRVIALKLLREPAKAPRNIRTVIANYSKQWTRIDKIYVNIAPSLDDAEWYVSQRNSTSTIQRRWTRLQQMRWVEMLYEKYGEDEDILSQKANLTLGEIEPMIRTIKLLNMVREENVKSALSEQEFADATSHRFPMTILERFFSMAKVHEAWGIEFDGSSVNFKNRAGFLTAYSQLIKIIVHPTNDFKIDTRTVSVDTIERILDRLPKVDINVEDPYSVGVKQEEEQSYEAQPEQPCPKPKSKDLRGYLNRNCLILGCYNLNTTEARLNQLFWELKWLSLNRYVSVCAAAVRIFLDLAVLDFIQSEGLVEDIQRRNSKELKQILLKTRLDYLSRESKLKNNPKIVKILKGLINEKDFFSLDILNGYIHSKETVYLNKQYINGFWDHIFPLLQSMLDINEVKEE